MRTPDTSGAEKRAELQDLHVTWYIAMKRGKLKAMAEGKLKALTEQAEHLKAKIRARVEHPFHIVKDLFRHRKVRYKGLAKNTAQMHTLFALANLRRLNLAHVLPRGIRQIARPGQCPPVTLSDPQGHQPFDHGTMDQTRGNRTPPLQPGTGHSDRRRLLSILHGRPPGDPLRSASENTRSRLDHRPQCRLVHRHHQAPPT